MEVGTRICKKSVLKVLQLVLAGLRPETVFEVCSRALNLYTYQTSQERAFLENTCHKLDERVRTQDSNLQQQLHQAVAESKGILCIFQAAPF